MKSVCEWCIHVARGVRSALRFKYPIFGYKNPTTRVLLHRVSQSLGSCADITPEALVTRMKRDHDSSQSRPRSPLFFWSAPRTRDSGHFQGRKSLNHGLPARLRTLRNLKQQRLSTVTKMDLHYDCA